MISEFISILNIKAKFYKITLVNVHAPTEEKDDSTKNMFYKLEDIISNLPKYDVTVMLAALNVKIEWKKWQLIEEDGWNWWKK